MSKTSDASRRQRQGGSERGLLLLLLLLLLTWLGPSDAGRAPPAKDAPAKPEQPQHDPVIEEVTSKQLERLLKDKDYVAVYWCKCNM